MEHEHSKTGTTRIFTLKEANGLLPHVNRVFDKVFFLNQRIKSLTNDVENLVSIWGKDVLEKGHIDNEYYFSLVSERENTFQELIRNVNAVQSFGCIVKDVENGLVDFYYDNDGELVFLCWKYGEKKISHWHALDNGFSNRKDVKQLRQ